jgi:hypothetical protein
MSLPCAPNVMILREPPAQQQATRSVQPLPLFPTIVHFTLRVSVPEYIEYKAGNIFPHAIMSPRGQLPQLFPAAYATVSMRTDPPHFAHSSQLSRRRQRLPNCGNTLTVYEVMSDPRTLLQAASSARCYRETCENELAMCFLAAVQPNVMILRERPVQHQAEPLSRSTPAIPHNKAEISPPTPFHGSNSLSRSPPPLSHPPHRGTLRPCIRVTVVAATSTESPKATYSQDLKCCQIREHRCRQRR